MSNKVAVAAIAGLSVVCLGLLLNNVQKPAEVSPVFVPAASQKTSDTSEGVSVSSEERKNFMADEYVTSFKMVSKDKSKETAYKRLNERREQILELLKKHSVSSEEYEFLSSSLEKEWKYVKGKRNFLGYEASQKVLVKFRNKLEADSMELDLSGLSYIDNVRTMARLKNADSLEVAIIKKACKKASKLADEYAQSVGTKVGKVISVKGSSHVDDFSLSDSVEVNASISSTLSLEGGENSGKSFVRVMQSEDKKFLADKFVVSLDISFEGANKETLFKQIGQKRNEIVQLAKDLGVAESEVDVQSMALRKKNSWELDDNERKTKAYRANQVIDVSFTSKEAAAAYMGGLVSFENVMVSNVQSVLKNADSLRVQVTNVAGEKAMARAKAIAEGFDGSLGRVISVSNELPSLGLGGLLGGRRATKARGKMSNAAYSLMDNVSSNSVMNIADSVSVSVFLEVTTEIK